MKVLIVAAEFPYPPIHGGRMDTWNRILALKKTGAEIYLLSWFGAKKGDVPTPEQISKVNEYVSSSTILSVSRNFKRLFNLRKYPSLVAARILTTKQYREILAGIKLFDPDILLIDHLYAAHTGLRLAHALQVPVSARLHNVEYNYVRGLYKLERSIKNKISLFLAKMHLERFENKVITNVDAFFDISLNDATYRKNLGHAHGHWLPPFLIMHDAPQNQHAEIKYDIGFAGNLYTPNNVKGLLWFINDILPLIKKEFANIRMVILGSQPVSLITNACRDNADNITLIANPPDINDYYKHINVLINPVQFGSGINIKSIDMLFRENQVVSTSVGISGLPAEFAEVFYISNDAEGFARNIIDLLNNKIKKDLSGRDKLKEVFNGSMMANYLELMSAKTQK